MAPRTSNNHPSFPHYTSGADKALLRGALPSPCPPPGDAVNYSSGILSEAVVPLLMSTRGRFLVVGWFKAPAAGRCAATARDPVRRRDHGRWLWMLRGPPGPAGMGHLRQPTWVPWRGQRGERRPGRGPAPPKEPEESGERAEGS
ncbi:hypothetical protein NDU88_011077 [Pleurodeles waltl]|uniref:Uncharacterized protein n=1 Tax=Pleurodeles waltl TaxID=8319 RepID=A0AAV7S2X2_PLEWA|nr:hypothetical protein NDU88_011077 [Pleurodeles waltl]